MSESAEPRKMLRVRGPPNPHPFSTAKCVPCITRHQRPQNDADRIWSRRPKRPPTRCTRPSVSWEWVAGCGNLGRGRGLVERESARTPGIDSQPEKAFPNSTLPRSSTPGRKKNRSAILALSALLSPGGLPFPERLWLSSRPHGASSARAVVSGRTIIPSVLLPSHDLSEPLGSDASRSETCPPAIQPQKSSPAFPD
jgi:hypothetical protein